MAFVYLATDQQSVNQVVIIVPRANMLQDPTFAGRFLREVRTLAQLSHPHIVRVFGAGEHQKLPYAVMQYLDRGSLGNILSKRLKSAGQPLSPQSLKSWLPTVAETLDFIHQKSIIHRDVKPDNILFDKQSKAYISDFGIVKAMGDAKAGTGNTVLTSAGMVVGTPEYMAPEVILGREYDGRADQYSLAITVYQTLTGRVPFKGKTGAEVMVLQTTQPVPPLDKTSAGTSPALAAVVHCALAKNPAQRFSTCQEFAQAVTTAAAGKAVAGSPPPLTPEAAKAKTFVSVTCPECGKRLRVPSTSRGCRCPGCNNKFPITEYETASEQSAATPGPQRTKAGDSSPAIVLEPSFDEQKSSFGKKWWFLIGGGVFLLALLAVGGILLFQSFLKGKGYDNPIDTSPKDNKKPENPKLPVDPNPNPKPVDPNPNPKPVDPNPKPPPPFTPRRSSDDIRFLPDNSALLGSFQYNHVATTEIIKRAIKIAKKDASNADQRKLDQIEDLGKEIDRVTFGLTVPPKNSGSNSAKVILVIRTNTDVTNDRLKNIFIDKFETPPSRFQISSVNGHTVYSMANGSDEVSYCVIDKRSVVLGNSDAVQQVLQRNGMPRLNPKLSRLVPGIQYSQWASMVAYLVQDNQSPQKNSPIYAALDMSINFSIQAHLRLGFLTNQEAESFYQQRDTLIATLKTTMQDLKMPTGLTKTLDSAVFSLNDSEVSVRANMSLSDAYQMLDTLGFTRDSSRG